MLDGTKKILADEYEDFVEAMCLAAEEDDLPVGLQYKNDKVKELTLQDLHDFMYEFHNDTGLDVEAKFYMCSRCGQLHLTIKVDWPDEEDDTPIQ